nr:uncharacterized protein LOC119172473 isoform X1 [Rhipicephalus microplus]
MGYGSYSRAARHIAEASTLGVLVFASSSRQETQPRETFGKAAHAQRDTATSLPVRISTRKPRNQRSFKVLPARKQPRCTLQYDHLDFLQPHCIQPTDEGIVGSCVDDSCDTLAVDENIEATSASPGLAVDNTSVDLHRCTVTCCTSRHP